MPLPTKIQEYIQRFQTDTPKPTFKNFFTQLESDYKEKLPYLFNIENFCFRVAKALYNKEKVCIYSDYDTDAVTATGVMHWGLIELGFLSKNLSFYAPDRLSEGYGLNPEAITNLSQKYDLIITVDCGINSTVEAKICSQNQADLIITDHHQLTGEIPEALSVVNPVLAPVYTHKLQELKPVNNYLADNLKLNQEKILIWLESMQSLQNKYLENQKTANFLSTSVTGVGVAWFALVWLAYFLQEIQ